jgi:hypothetical protein
MCCQKQDVGAKCGAQKRFSSKSRASSMAESDDSLEIIDPQTDDENASEFSVHEAEEQQYSTCRSRNNDTILESSEHSLESWWPNIGTTLIDSLYHADHSVRQNAVQALLPISELFPRIETLQLNAQTPELRSLYNLYVRKLVLKEKQLEEMMSEWIDRVNDVCARCSAEESRMQKALQELDAVASRLLRRYGEVANSVVSEQLIRAKTRLQRECDVQMRLARFEARARPPQATAYDHTVFDDDISEAENALSVIYPPETAQSIRQTYYAHVKKLEHELATKIQDRCLCEWAKGLAIPTVFGHF